MAGHKLCAAPCADLLEFGLGASSCYSWGVTAVDDTFSGQNLSKHGLWNTALNDRFKALLFKYKIHIYTHTSSYTCECHLSTKENTELLAKMVATYFLPLKLTPKLNLWKSLKQDDPSLRAGQKIYREIRCPKLNSLEWELDTLSVRCVTWATKFFKDTNIFSRNWCLYMKTPQKETETWMDHRNRTHFYVQDTLRLYTKQMSESVILRLVSVQIMKFPSQGLITHCPWLPNCSG